MSKTKKHKKTKTVRDKKDKKHSKSKKSTYKRGDLIRAMCELFKQKGIDNVSYEECKKLALRIKPNSKFNKAHLSWYKYHYRNITDV